MHGPQGFPVIIKSHRIPTREPEMYVELPGSEQRQNKCPKQPVDPSAPVMNCREKTCGSRNQPEGRTQRLDDSPFSNHDALQYTPFGVPDQDTDTDSEENDESGSRSHVIVPTAHIFSHCRRRTTNELRRVERAGN